MFEQRPAYSRSSPAGHNSQFAPGHGRVLLVRQGEQVIADRMTRVIGPEPRLTAHAAEPGGPPVAKERQCPHRKFRIVFPPSRRGDFVAAVQALAVGSSVKLLDVHGHGAASSARAAATSSSDLWK